MFNTFRLIAAHIRDKVTDLKWIDRDKGQLENPVDFHSIIVPGVLLNFSEVDWIGGTGGNQTGTCTMTVKLIFRLPVATYEDASWNNYEEYERISDILYNTLSAFKDIGDRVKSSDYFTKEFYVAEQIFDLTVYKTRKTRTIPKPAPDIKGTIHATLNIPNQ